MKNIFGIIFVIGWIIFITYLLPPKAKKVAIVVWIILGIWCLIGFIADLLF